jgi:flagellar basal-body rod protein FlgB
MENRIYGIRLASLLRQETNLNKMDPGLNKLSAALDALVLRQKITASNIANIDTEGYNKRRVEFEKYLKEAKLNGDTAVVKPSIETTDEKVDLDKELIEMAETQMKVQFVTRMIRSQLELTKMGITGNPNSRL